MRQLRSNYLPALLSFLEDQSHTDSVRPGGRVYHSHQDGGIAKQIVHSYRPESLLQSRPNRCVPG